MNGEVNGVFIYNGSPQNGATAQLWQITGFAAYTDSTDDVQDNPLTISSIEVNVSDGTTFAVGDVIKIENELFRISDIATNTLYVIRGYRGTAPAAHAQAAGQPTYAKYDDNGAVSDLPNAIDNAPATEESFAGFVAADDHVLVCGSAKFGGLLIDIGTTPNAVASVVSVECSDGGTGWLACALLDDGTDAAGASMAVDGTITFTPHVDWASDTFDGDTGFWVRLTWTANWTAGADIAEIDLTMLATINDETITEPAQDTTVPAGYQQGGDITTAVTYGGDGAYRWTAVPEGEYYVAVTYDGHIGWIYASVETNDPTPSQILTLDGDLIIHNADGVTRLPTSTIGYYLRVAGTGRAAWQGGAGAANLTVAETEVYNAAAPVGWTDLDLSGTIGANSALVLMKVWTAGVGAFGFRKNGDADEFYRVDTNAGCANVDMPVAEYHLVILVATDNAGVIEWTHENNDNTTLDIIAFIN